MKRRLTAVLLTICMVLLMMPAFAVPAAALPIGGAYTLFLNGSDGKIYKNSSLDEDMTSELASMGAEVSGSLGAWVLTLTNFNFTNSEACALQVPDGISIVLVGNNIISCKYESYRISDNTTYGIYAMGSLTISGDGSLEVESGFASDSNYGVFAVSELMIDGNVTVDATGNSGKRDSAGIYSTGSITICDDATVTATSHGANYKSAGIYSYGGELTIRDRATVTSLCRAGTDSFGIYANKTITICGEAVVETSSRYAMECSAGISSTDDIVITDNAIVNTGSGRGRISFGIISGSDLIIGGNSNVNATGGSISTSVSAGIKASTITIDSNATVTSTGERSKVYSAGAIATDCKIGDNATATFTGGYAERGSSLGIYLYGGTISGRATVNATGGLVRSEENDEDFVDRSMIHIEEDGSYGIYSFSKITFSDNATLSAIGGDAATGISCGLYLRKGYSIVPNGGTVIVAGNTRAMGADYTVPNGYKYAVSANADGTYPATGISDGSFVLDNKHKHAVIESRVSDIPNRIVIENTENGTITVDNDTPISGQVITVTLIPNRGHVGTNLSITDDTGNGLPSTSTEAGTDIFEFTSGTITISADFIERIDQPLPFTDINRTDWFYADIQYVYAKGLFNGVTDTIFEPNTSMTRGMIVTVLGRLRGINPSDYTNASFDDVDSDAYYAPYIKWAVEEGIVLGVGGNKFNPDAIISRQDLATIMHRYFPQIDEYYYDAEKITFDDDNLISDYAAYSVEIMQRKGIINGKPGNVFDPLGNATRAEVAVMLHRFVKTLGIA